MKVVEEVVEVVEVVVTVAGVEEIFSLDILSLALLPGLLPGLLPLSFSLSRKSCLTSPLTESSLRLPPDCLFCWRKENRLELEVKTFPAGETSWTTRLVLFFLVPGRTRILLSHLSSSVSRELSQWSDCSWMIITVTVLSL